jgi:hypothetical protein
MPFKNSILWNAIKDLMDKAKPKNKLGGQSKVPRLSNSREYIEEVFKLM